MCKLFTVMIIPTMKDKESLMPKQYAHMDNSVVHVHKDRIVTGDVIVCPDGRGRTVCQADIKYSSLMGVTIFGDSYHAGHKLVPLVPRVQLRSIQC